jgi:hypothetical protein
MRTRVGISRSATTSGRGTSFVQRAVAGPTWGRRNGISHRRDPWNLAWPLWLGGAHRRLVSSRMRSMVTSTRRSARGGGAGHGSGWKRALDRADLGVV